MDEREIMTQHIVIATETGTKRTFAYLVNAETEVEAINQIVSPGNTIVAVTHINGILERNYGRLKVVKEEPPVPTPIYVVNGYFGF